MANFRRNSDASLRATARRQREDEAPRLRTEVPDLDSLNLEVREQLESGTVTSTHIKRVVVDHAPALFVLSCADRSCKDGGHDLTREILTALRNHKTAFEGSHACDGSIGSSRCTSTLHFKAVATYRPAT